MSGQRLIDANALRPKVREYFSKYLVDEGVVSEEEWLILKHNKNISKIIKEAPTVEIPRWISVNDAVPNDGENVLVLVSGKPRENITFINAVQMACWSKDEGWILESYPEVIEIRVSHWARIPEIPEELRGEKK